MALENIPSKATSTFLGQHKSSSLSIQPIFYPENGIKNHRYNRKSFKEFNFTKKDVYNLESHHVYNYIAQNKEIAKNTII